MLPDVESRPACTTEWPPAIAEATAKPVGRWTIIQRKDGGRQWAYDGSPLYTSRLDEMPGDVYGGSTRYSGGDGPATREPVGPPPDVPPGFRVKTTSAGRLLVTDRELSVYVSDGDKPDSSACEAECAKTWLPLDAPASGRRTASGRVFRGRTARCSGRSAIGPSIATRSSATPTASSAATFRDGTTSTRSAPPIHRGISRSRTRPPGQVLADARGMTIYVFGCGDDAEDQLSCDHPTTTQAYRIAMCGGGDVARCLRSFSYVIAPPGMRATSRTWRAVDIDPQTGRFGRAGQPGCLHVWAYRDRPVYTYSGDRQPGDVNADSHGEFRGERNGFKAFWLRDDYFGHTG